MKSQKYLPLLSWENNVINDITATIKEKIGSANNKIQCLKNAYKGEVLYVVSCGPSLSKIDPNILREKLKTRLVVGIKQAYNFMERECDFHIYNFVHFEQYNYDGRPTIIMETARPQQPLGNPDILMPINMRMALNWKNYNLTMAVQRNYEQFLFDKTLERPLGPGIFYEVIPFLAIQLGCSKIVSIGFDCAQASSHFYGKENVSLERKKQLEKEMSIVAGQSPQFISWLNSKGVELEILSDINPIKCKKITIADI
jgi:hypothetical protein